MKFNYLIIGFTFFTPCFSAQTKSYTLSLYYNINEVRPLNGFHQLDSLDETWNKNTYKVSIYGYADFLSSGAYNKSLSQQRADLVKHYLLKKSSKPRVTILVWNGKGEQNSGDNKSREGDPYQRRVDICISESIAINGQEKVKEKPGKETLPAATKSVTPKKSVAALEAGEILTLEGLTFIPGRHVLLESAKPVMEELLKTLEKHPKIKIEIQGHICCSSGQFDMEDLDTHNKNLSHMRAFAIYSYLVEHGIDKKRMKYLGYGNSRSKVSVEITEEDRQLNRRVDIKVLEN